MAIKNKTDFWTSIVLLLAMAFLYQQAEEFSYSPFSTNSPQFFPLILIGFISLLSLKLLFSSIGSNKDKKVVDSQKFFHFSSSFLLQCFVIIGLVLYITLLPVISYIPSTALFLFICMGVLDGTYTARKLLLYAMISGITTGVLYFIFAHILKFFLP
ncbi:tripartite tricarboxylate transporter TctB family protein [Bilophila wadsworthia]|uniref:tripartite tricarboxylate transporter TctB family protein n=1 Tax=Bilophila wadsworthia TaxID=35833 RepID=UPI002432E33D|nr:tripartite tricarboxylate transporter TctB family protein [Bilophila wadsworthia]